MTSSKKLFPDEPTNCLIYEVGLKYFKYQIPVYYKYISDGYKLVVLYYVYQCAYWYASEELGHCFVDTLGNILHVNFLGYAHWVMYIRISQIKDQSISVKQAIYATSVVAKYIYIATIKLKLKFHKNTLPNDMIFTKYYDFTSDK